jgi:hypothetical protein
MAADRAAQAVVEGVPLAHATAGDGFTVRSSGREELTAVVSMTARPSRRAAGGVMVDAACARDPEMRPRRT